MTQKTISEKSLRPGYFFCRNGERFCILPGEKHDILSIQVENVDTAVRQTIRVEELFNSSSSDSDRIFFGATLEALQEQVEQNRPSPAPLNPHGLPPGLLHRAEKIIQIIEAVDQMVSRKKAQCVTRKEKFQKTPTIRWACDQLPDPIKPATYFKYRQIFLAGQGDRTRIAASLRRSTFNQTKIDGAQLHFVDAHILRFYARGHFMRLRPLTLYRILHSTWQRTSGLWLDPSRCPSDELEKLVEILLNPKQPAKPVLENPENSKWLKPIGLPSRSWFYRYLRWYEHEPEKSKVAMIARYGKETWEREHLVFDSFVARAAFPLQYVFADHWLLDALTVDEDTRSHQNRLWLTMLIDAFSRSILGMALLYEDPCTNSLQSALRHAIWPKVSHQRIGIAGEWVCYGIPQQLSLDNALAHQSFSLENLCRVIGYRGQYNSIDLLYRPPYKGRYGALIERFFGNLSAQVKELLPGALRSNDRASLQQAIKDACLIYQDIDYILQRMTVDYQHTPHKELGGLTPHQKWLEGMKMGLPIVPPLTPNLERAFWRMSPSPRTMTNKGICVFGMHYWSNELNKLPRLDMKGAQIKYHFSYEAADISRIALFRNEEWLGDVYAKELRQLDGSSLPLSLWEYKIAKELCKDRETSTQNWLGYVSEIDALTRTRLAEKKKIHRKLSQTNLTSSGEQVSSQEASSSYEIPKDKPADPMETYTDLLVQFADPRADYTSLEPTRNGGSI